MNGVRGATGRDASSGPGQISPSERLERRNRELAILNRIAQALNRSGEVQEALDSTLGLVAELLGLRSAWVWLLDPEGRPYLAAARHLPPFLREPARMEGWLCRCLDAFTRGAMASAANIDVLECSRLERAASESGGLRYHASIPLYLGARKVGVMNVAGPDWRQLSAEELDLLRTIGSQVAVAVERARLSEEGAHAARLQERNRLAREIHDTLAQQLAGIALHLETADLQLPERPREAQERVRRAVELVREGLAEARRSVDDLRAAPLEGTSLAEALRNLGALFTHQTGIRTHVELDPHTLPDLSADAETALYRIAQEGLTNIRKHAAAHRATVRVTVSGRSLRLEVRDDGRGFHAAVEPGEGRLGIAGMRERAHLLGGQLRVSSAPGRGTRVVVRLPLPPTPEDAP